MRSQSSAYPVPCSHSPLTSLFSNQEMLERYIQEIQVAGALPGGSSPATIIVRNSPLDFELLSFSSSRRLGSNQCSCSDHDAGRSRPSVHPGSAFRGSSHHYIDVQEENTDTVRWYGGTGYWTTYQCQSKMDWIVVRLVQGFPSTEREAHAFSAHASPNADVLSANVRLNGIT
jgi:hypothetical protein